MNGQEQATLESFDRKLTKAIEIGNKREEISEKRWLKIEPIVKAYHDKKIINEFLRGGWKVFVGLLTVLAIIGSIVSVVWAIFFRGN